MAEREPRPRTVGVVLAGGVGRRVGHDTPKQLLEIAGRTILEHTLALFQGAPEIDEIMVLMAPGFTGEVERIVERNGFTKVGRILEGGASRPETTWRALRALGTRECHVLLHDAVRPLTEPRIIADCVEALRTFSAVEVAIPSSDTIVVTSQGPHGEVVSDVPDRAGLRRVQTPQCFRLSVIREAYERAFADPGFGDRPPTDDCGVVLRYLPDVPIHVVPGSERNMKVTHPVDLFVADGLLRLAASDVPARSDAALREALEGRTVVVFRADDGAGAEVARLAGHHGARVFPFSGLSGLSRLSRLPGPSGPSGPPGLPRPADSPGTPGSAKTSDSSKTPGLPGAADSFGRPGSPEAPRLPGIPDGVRVDDPRAVADALARVVKETGGIDYVVGAAGAPPPGRLDAVDDAAIAGTVNAEHLGPVTVARAALPHLRETRGQLLFHSPPPARDGAGEGLRSFAGAAVAGLTRALAEEWAEYGVRVNCVDPGRAGATTPPGPSSPYTVARTSLDVLASGVTGQVVDARP
ncbi:bifunctional cytidylyltransferase/SDR family oxidoreductase [Streptosporangium sp. NBC_01495]|uniref:bifunctional cytidylyltransferase/SDR family oxidoreductase n=1 Tax=Streptosporangium sp. NBC_01495 TaxID=2903899 RepID=UPI002E319C6A|nr:bifunctional cytidylyltransferase/SDR family oxidoreductase [Streptosporangium sp. NBC_01495]